MRAPKFETSRGSGRTPRETAMGQVPSSLLLLPLNRASKGVKRAVLEAFQGCRRLRSDKHCITVLPFDLTAQYLLATPNPNGLRVRGLLHIRPFLQRPILIAAL